MDLSRDLFLSEFIINYLQTTYPDVYSDIAIIHKYIEYKQLKDLEIENDLSDKDRQRLDELNVYFFGSSSGELNGDAGYNLITMYKNTVDIIEKLIDTNDTAVHDVVNELVSLIQVNIKDDDAFKKYINELVLPSIFKENAPTVSEETVKGTLQELPKVNYTIGQKLKIQPEIKRKSDIINQAKVKEDAERAQRIAERQRIIDEKAKQGNTSSFLSNLFNPTKADGKSDDKKEGKSESKKTDNDEEPDNEEEADSKDDDKKADDNSSIIYSNSPQILPVNKDVVIKDFNPDEFFDIDVEESNIHNISLPQSPPSSSSSSPPSSPPHKPSPYSPTLPSAPSSPTSPHSPSSSSTPSPPSSPTSPPSSPSTAQTLLQGLSGYDEIKEFHTIPSILLSEGLTINDSDLFIQDKNDDTQHFGKIDLFRKPATTGGFNKINDFDEIYDKVKDLKIIKKINNKELIYLLLNTHSLSSLITKNKSEKILKQYINSILLTIIEKLKKTIKIFIKNDVLLSSYFDLREIIFYNLINYLYPYYGYVIDYKILGNIIEILNSDYNYHVKKNNKYLLFFIYKYSKLQDISKLIGYDSFKTYITINSLGKLNDKIKLNNVSYNISDSKSLSLYNFIDLKREFNVHLTDIQLKQSIKELKKFSVENKKGYFVINSEIIDKICIYSDNIFKKKYNNLAIINFDNYLEKKIEIPKSFSDITYSILYLSSFLFRNEKEISSKIYCELVRNYVEIEKTNKTTLKSIAYQMIYMMYKRINKNKLLEKLQKIKTIEQPQLFINPKLIKIEKFNEIIISFLIDFYNYCEAKKLYNSFYDIFVPFLSYYYYYDINNKLQIMAQELLCNKKNKFLLGGGYDDEYDNHKIEYREFNEKNNYKSEDQEDNSFTQEKIEMIKQICEEIKKKPERIESDKEALINKIKDIFTLKLGGKTIDIGEEGNYESEIDTFIQDNSLAKPENIQNLNQLLTTINIKLSNIKSIIDTESKELRKIDYEIKINDELEKFIEVIDNQDLKEYDSPSLLRIQSLNKSKPILKSIKDYNSYWKTILKDCYDEIFNFYTNLENRIDIIKNAIRANKIDDRYNRYDRDDRDKKDHIDGGSKFIRGGADIPKNLKDNIEKLVKKLQDKGNDIKKEIDEISVDLGRFKTKQFVTANPTRKIISNEIIDKNDYNIFDKLLNSYEADYNNPKIPHQITDDLFYTKVKANNLDPEEELKITFNDKLIFIGVVYVLRLIASYMTYYMIEMSYSTTLSRSLYYYILCYILVFIIIVFIINFDTFFLRIFVNYLNMHINTLGITTHIFLMVVFVYIVYLLIININGYEREKSRLNDSEKIKLKYKMDLLTMIIFVFICLLTFII